MKNGRMANKRILKWVASGVMLALLFAMVFAGTLSGAFGVENALQNSGVIENNVASAAHTDGFNGTPGGNTTLLYDSNKGLYYGDQYLRASITDFTVGMASGREHSYIPYFQTGTSGERDGARIYHASSGAETIYLGWDISFKDSMYHAINNGAIEKILFKVETYAPGSGDETELKVRKYDQGDDCLGYSGTSTSRTNTRIVTLAIEKLKEAIYGSSYKFFLELKLKPNGNLDVYFHSAWVDIYKSDTTAPTITYDPATKKFEFNDATAGIYKVYKNGTDVTSSIADMSADTKSCSYTCGSNDSGNVTFKVVDNVGNTVETTYYLFKGTGTSSDPFRLRNRTDFDGLSTCVSNGITFSGKNFKVEPASGDTIDMGSEKFTPIGNASHKFSGIIDGDSKTVSNLKVEVDNYAGLFGYTSGAEIKNMSVSGYSFASGMFAGLLVAQMDGGTISGETNIKLVGKSSSDGVYGTFAGGMVGSNSGGTISGTVTVSGDEVDKESGGVYMMGGVVGYNTGTISATVTCSVRVIVRSAAEFPFSDSNKVTGAFAGGIVGVNNGGILSGTFNRIHEVDSEGNLINGDTIAPSNHDYVGGIVGYNNGGTLSGQYKHSSTYTAYEGVTIYGNQFVGGIVGFTTGCTITGAVNKGAVKGVGANGVGGIVGGIASGVTITIVNCENNAPVTATAANGVAGILGRTENAANKVEIYGCKNTGEIQGQVNTGGIGGRIESTKGEAKALYFHNNYNTGDISTSSGNTVGGIVGYLFANSSTNNAAVLEYCFSSGNVKSGDSEKNEGGIVGNPAGGANKAVVSYCYTTQDKKIAGTANGTVNGNNYIIVSSTSNGSVTNGGSYFVHNGLSVVPAKDGTTFTYTVKNDNDEDVVYADWAKITANNINQLVVTGKLTNGKYMWIASKADGTAGAVVSSVSGAKTPIAQNTNKRNAEDTSAFNGDLSCTFEASRNQNVHVKIADINMEIVDKEYSGSGQQCYSKDWKSGLPTGTSFQNAYYIHGKDDDVAWYSRTVYTEKGYDVVTDIKINVNGVTKVIGRYVSNDDSKIWRITKAELKLTPTWSSAVSGDNPSFTYNASNQGLTAFEFTGFKKDDNGNTASDLTITVNPSANYTMDGFKYTLVDSADVKNAASYSVTITVKSNNYTVDGMTDGTKTYKWTINKRELSITWNETTRTDGKYTYNQAQQGVDYFTFGNFAGSENLNTIKNSITVTTTNDASYVIGNAQYKWANNTCCINADNYRVSVAIDATNYKLETNTETSKFWTINKFDLGSDAVLGGSSNLTLGNTGAAKDFGNNQYYELNNALIYTAGSGYKKGSFVLYVQYNNGKYATLVLGDNEEYTLKTSTTATSGYSTNSDGLHCATGDPIDVRLTATGKGNFTGSIEVTYTAMISDFGGRYGSDNWGSENNKFWISHPAHLIRLSEIVNGGKAWNSWTSLNGNVASGINSNSYQNAYFEVQVSSSIALNIVNTAGNKFDFTPIGKNSSYAFSGTFDGNKTAIVGLQVNSTAEYAGLFGYASGATFKDIQIGTHVAHAEINGTGHVAGLVGHMAGGNITGTITCYTHVTGTGGMVGGIVGENHAKHTGTVFTHDGNVTGGTYDDKGNYSRGGNTVGGVFAFTDKPLTGAKNYGSVLGGTAVGGIVGRTQSTLTNCTNSASVTSKVPSSSKQGGEVKNLGAAVGGITGYTNNAITDCTNTGAVEATNASCVGGIVGIAGFYKTDRDQQGNITAQYWIGVQLSGCVNSGSVEGYDYVGGVAGYWWLTNGSQFGVVKNVVENSNNITVKGNTYVGGIAGWIETSDCSNDVNITPDTSIKDNTITVTGKNCVGYLFGALVGNGYHGTSDASIATKLNIGSVFTGSVNGTDGGAVLGGLVGFMSKSVMMFSIEEWKTANITFGNMTNMSFVGGLVGMLGENGSIESAVTYENGSFLTGGVYTITANTTFGSEKNRLGNFVGGIVGYVTSSAGTFYSADDSGKVSETAVFKGLNFVNAAPIYAKSYVGGIFGAVGNLEAPSVVSNFDNNIQGFMTSLLASGNYEGESTGATLRLYADAEQGDKKVAVTFKNKAEINASGDYVGGIIGYVGDNTTINFTGSLETFDVSCRNVDDKGNDIAVTITGVNYVGGIIGHLGNTNIKSDGTTTTLSQRFTNIVAHVSVQGTSKVGGIVGGMNSAQLDGCIVILQGYSGDEHVGGLVGHAQNNIVANNCFTTGFDITHTTNTIGGLVGLSVSSTFTNTWTFYVADKEKDENGQYKKDKDGNTIPPTYSAISKNSYGKYIAVDDDFDVALTLANIVAFVNGKQLAFDVTVPTNNKQLAFYDASGNDTVTNNIAENKEDSKFKEFGYANGKITIVLDAESGYSMLVYTTPVKFVNVAQGVTGETEKVRVAYRHPSSSEHYDADVTSATFTDGIVTHVQANIYFNPYGNECVLVAGSTTEYEYSDDGKQVGAYDQGFIKGSEASPYTISNWTEWQQFATSVKNGTTYSGLHISLTQTISGNATGYLAGDATHSFMGTFNGNGYTINIGNITSASDGTSLFPYANGATFKNLTIAGRITSSHKGTAGFVGIAGGSLTFENCTNQVAITSSGKNVGGILGQSHYGEYTYKFEDCVNEETGVITNSINSTVTAAGGIVGNIITSKGTEVSVSYGGYDDGDAKTTVTLESCRNAADITGTFNIGGIIGRNGGKTTIKNSGNTGNLTANGANFTTPSQVNQMDTSVGGIGGLTTYNASIHVYASYNSGNILGWGNKAGGILAADAEYNASTIQSKVYYCYNTGNITTGGPNPRTFTLSEGDIQGKASYGGLVGGILGSMIYADVQYCYNTGQITANGIIGESAATILSGAVWKVRAGGIVGYADGNDTTKKSIVKNCYNIGIIEIGSWGAGVLSIGAGIPAAAAPIIGGTSNKDYIQDNDKTNNNYSIKGSVRAVYDKDGNVNTSYMDTKGNEEAKWPIGNSLNSIDQMTAYMNDNGTMSMPSGGFNANGQKTDALSNITSTGGGYIYVYGCLPQLAVFAVDTQNGLAMTSEAYGVDQYGNYTLQPAGSESNPFVIKDGIDLLGLQSLVELKYNFSGKFIEFANSNNNLEKTQAKEIEFPTHSSTSEKYSGNGYKSTDGSQEIVNGTSQTKYVAGKSYHLFEKGAVCADWYNAPANDGYVAWLGRNTYQAVTTGSTVPTKNATYEKINIPTIGRTINLSFHGNISGKQSDGSATRLMNVRISAGYAGLFSVTKNATVSYIEISGNSTISSVNVAGGIVARPRGTSVVDHCAISGSTTVMSYGKNTGFSYSAGGIVGYAYTRAEDNNAFDQGATLIISNCTVNTTGNIVGYKENIGGILGTTLDFNAAEGKNNMVLIENCKVLAGNIYAEQSDSQYVGGIIGYSSFNGDRTRAKNDDESEEHYEAEKKKAETLLNIIVGITGCEVGTGSGSVTISGINNIGGIAGAVSKVQGGYIKDCTVGANATITATADCSNIGGIVGSNDDGSGDTLRFYGKNSFAGNIDVGTYNANGENSTTGIGGIIGTMNNGANFDSTSVITVTGKIRFGTDDDGDNAGVGHNIGGVAGYTKNVAFSGKYTVGPTLITGTGDNVGGFIGKNTGETHILAEGTEIEINGNINGKQEVGGFIGVNDSSAKLYIGRDSYNALDYVGTLTITVNATINAGGNNAGGIVGKNEGSVSIVKGTISTSTTSSVSGANNVGGIIGLNDGDLATGGSTVTGAQLSITNGGKVSGKNYVGGVFGLLNKGNIAGEFTNSGNVEASGYFAGGVIGYLAGGASIGFDKNETAITLNNSGSVSASSYAGGSIGYVEKGATIIANSNTSAKVTLINSGSVGVTNYFAGGSIGVLYGSIEGTENNRVLFSVAGSASIAGESYLGGSIGIIAGKIDYAQFTNSADLEIKNGETAIGGSVGFVGLPSADYVTIDSTYDKNFAQVQLGDIVISNSHFESTGSLKVDTTSSQAESGEVDHTTSGGVGGAIGVIGGDGNLFKVQYDDGTKGWNNNTYYAMANVIAPSVNNVGGVFGLVRANGFVINNMLAYQTQVQGNYNVGGIVGAITGENVEIASSFALEGKFSGAGNVGGIVGLAQSDTNASTAYWMLGLDNTTLAGSNVTDLSDKLGFNGSGNSLTYAIKAKDDAKIYTTGNKHTGWFFLYANDANGSNGMGTINVTHKEGETNGVSNSLAYWKYIAQAYSVGETVPDTMTGSALTSDGTISPNYVYATATAAPVANGGTGYYLYTQTSQGGTNPNITHYTTTDNKDAFYININTSQNVGNFVVYYRMITSGNALTYNGYQRIGVVGMDGVTIFTDGDIHNHTFAKNEREKYYFTTATTETTEGGQAAATTPMTNAGTYSSNINIYYVDKGGNVYNVGGNSAMTWTINKRDLSIVLNDGDQVNNRWYGQEWQKDGSINYDMKFVISNIAPGQYNKEVCTITVNDFIFTIKINENGTEASVTYSGDNKGVLLNATVTTATTENPEDKTYIADGVDTSKGYYAKTLTCYLAFTIAKSYNVIIDVSTNGTVQNYTLPQSEYKFGVNARTLTVKPTSWTTGQTSTSPYTYVYNTKFQGLQNIGLDSGTSSGTTGLVNEDKVTLKVTVTLNTGKETFTVSDTTEAFGATDNANIVDIIKKIDKYGFVGTYTVKYEVGADGGGKYSITTDSDGNSDTWKITQYEVKFNGFSNMGAEKTYDATAVVPILNISSEGITNDNGTYTYGDDTFTLTYKINNSSSAEKLVNAGTYNITIGSSNGSINASRKDNNDIGNTSENYKFSGTTSTTTYRIKPRSVALTWETTSSFVYSASYQGLKVTGVSQDETFTYSVSGATLTGATLSVKKGGTIVDKITLKYSGSQKDVCNGEHMSYSSHSVDPTYKHDGIQTDKGNYTINNTTSGNYSIVPSDLKISSALVSGATKVYDGNTNVTNGKISWSITNGNNNGHIPTDSGEDESSYSYFKLTSKAFVSKDVGNNIGISVAISFVSSDKNYTGSNYSATIYGGTITPKPIMVVLSGLRNGKATKVYDGDATYAGSISGNGTAGSRLGERFTVSGLLDNNVTISANYKEAVEDRSFFDSYVNGVFKNADNTYSQEANKYYKKLVFTMSGDGANNYKFNVYNATNQAYGKADGVGKDSTVTVYDSADETNKDNCGVAGGITIEITINSVRVTYSGTYQSYVDENGGYKEKWERVKGTISGVSDKDVVKVHNYWMYADGIDDELDEGYKKYTGYTIINGSKNSKLLYAEVSPEKGMQYNYRLSNQPTLTIAYFVSETGAFEIDSMSDLLIASFYYSASQNATAPEFVQIVKSGYKWVELVSNEEYEADMATWDAEFAKHEGVFLNETSTEDGMKANWWGYYEATEDSTGKTIPTSFKLTKDIYGMLTKDDIEKLTAFFTVAKSDDNGNITQTPYEWGNGKTYLANLLTTKEGSVITLLGSLFVTDSGKDGFSGSFDGNGYVIEYLNIMGYGYNNVGLFDVIGAGTVKDLHLRNININADKGNVGGIAGQIKASEENSAVSNVSFHGAINVSGNDAVNVGGLFGTSARAISNAIVLGTINSSNTSAVVGGVVGSSSASISNVVSMMQINANGTTGAFVGGGTNATDSYHMANAVYNGTAFVNVTDSAKTYSDLMGGSKTGYGTNKYYYESGTTIADDYKGTYDVLADVVYVNSNSPDNARQSMRLRDIVSVYLLMYSLSESNISTSGEYKINVYTISSESWLVGSKHGTNAENDAIVIANKQNVSLLRELRFATFTLASNIDVTISSTFSGAFYGTVNLNGHTLTCNQQMFDVYYKEGVVQTADWLTIK